MRKIRDYRRGRALPEELQGALDKMAKMSMGKSVLTTILRMDTSGDGCLDATELEQVTLDPAPAYKKRDATLRDGPMFDG